MPRLDQLPVAAAVAGTDLVLVEQGGVAKQAQASQLGGGGSTPTGTGFRHVTGGAEDAAAVTVDPTNAAHMTVGVANTVLTSNGAVGVWNAIVNAFIDPAAAIAGTKISPDFGSQQVKTTGSIALGATPASTGLMRLYATGASQPLIRWNDGTADRDVIIGDSTGNGLSFGGTGFLSNLYGSSTTVYAASNLFLYGGATQSMTFNGASNFNSLPMVGNSVAWGSINSVGTQAMADANQTAAAAVFSYFCIKTTGALTATRTLTLPTATDAQGFMKLIDNTCTGAFGVTVQCAAGTTVTIANGKSALVWVDSRGVTRITPDT